VEFVLLAMGLSTADHRLTYDGIIRDPTTGQVIRMVHEEVRLSDADWAAVANYLHLSPFWPYLQAALARQGAVSISLTPP
jgi:hypothetical protein